MRGSVERYKVGRDCRNLRRRGDTNWLPHHCVRHHPDVQAIHEPGYFDISRTWPACINYSRRSATSAAIAAERGELQPAQLPYVALQTLVHATFVVVMEDAKVERKVKDGYLAFRAQFERAGKACWWPLRADARGSTAAQTADGSAPAAPVAPAVPTGDGVAAGASTCQPLAPSALPVGIRVAEPAEASAGQRLVPDAHPGAPGAAAPLAAGTAAAAGTEHVPSALESELSAPAAADGAILAVDDLVLESMRFADRSEPSCSPS